MIDPNSAFVQDGMTTRQLLEAEMFADLAAGITNPPAGDGDQDHPGDGPAADPAG